MELVTGKIYILKSSQTDKIYIGSTTQSLKRRLQMHNSRYKNNNNKENYSAFEILKFDDCYIELIKEVSCTKKQLLILEGDEIVKNQKCVNNRIAGHSLFFDTIQDYYNFKGKKYRTKNKEAIQEKKSEKIICGCGENYTMSHKARHEKSIKHKIYILEKI